MKFKIKKRNSKFFKTSKIIKLSTGIQNKKYLIYVRNFIFKKYNLKKNFFYKINQ